MIEDNLYSWIQEKCPAVKQALDASAAGPNCDVLYIDITQVSPLDVSSM
jgi:hypothetical protein